MCVCGFCNVWLCICGFCNVLVCVFVGFVTGGCLHEWMCEGVGFVMCGFCNVWVL